MLLGSLGLLVALHLPQRLWQGANAWFGGNLTQPLDAATPFDNIAAPNAVFPLLALAVWLQGAAVLLWLNRRAAPQEDSPAGEAGLQPQVVPGTGKAKPPVILRFAQNLRSVGQYPGRKGVAPTARDSGTAPQDQNLTGSNLKFGILPAFAVPALSGLLLLGALLVGLGERAGQLLPDSLDRLPASNYDEMVYFSGSSLLAQGQLPYRDFFLAHPPVSELFYGTLLKLGGLAQGGYTAFLAARWGAIGLGLLTILGLFWVGGRLWSPGEEPPARGKGEFAWLPALGAAWLYALDARAAAIATLETPANFFTILGLGCYLEAGRTGRRRLQTGLLAGSGVLLALAVLSKLPAAVFPAALLAWLLFQREWRALLWHLAGLAAGAIAILGPFALLSGPGEVLRQVVFFQLLRPDETRAGKDQLGRLADYPDNALTIFAGGAALLFLAVWLAAGGRDKGRWLIPALASLPLVVIFTLSKSFHPWYYVQWALPLALLGAGLFSASRWRTVAAGAARLFRRKPGASPAKAWWGGAVLIGLLALFFGLPLALAGWQQSQQPPLDRAYRATGAAIAAANAPGDVLDFDPGYNFMAGQRPARLPSSGKYLVDSAGYMVYLNLDMDRTGLFALLGKGLSGSGQADTAGLFHRERAQALVVEGLARAGWVVVDGVLALPQLTPQSVEFIGTAAAKAATIDYAGLYRVRPLAVRQPWTFDNGLVLTPFGLSTSRSGQANADPVEPGEIIRLTAAEAGSRSLDLRFVWRVTRPQTAGVKMFIHLVNGAGTTVAQQDLAPQQGQADTAAWRVGDAYQDVHGLPLPGNLAAGSYKVEIGIYNAVGGERIMAGGQASLTLGTIIIS